MTMFIALILDSVWGSEAAEMGAGPTLDVDGAPSEGLGEPGCSLPAPRSGWSVLDLPLTFDMIEELIVALRVSGSVDGPCQANRMVLTCSPLSPEHMRLGSASGSPEQSQCQQMVSLLYCLI